MRRFGTGLFLSGEGLYKAPAAFARDRSPPSRERGSVAQSLLYDGSERNLGMAVTLSVVVPVKDEAENVEPLAREIAAAVAGEAAPELIFVDDGSTDSTASVLRTLKTSLPSLRIISHGRNSGQSRAVRTGVLAARGEIVVTLDGDGQNDPADIPDWSRCFATMPKRASGWCRVCAHGAKTTCRSDSRRASPTGFGAGC